MCRGADVWEEGPFGRRVRRGGHVPTCTKATFWSIGHDAPGRRMAFGTSNGERMPMLMCMLICMLRRLYAVEGLPGRNMDPMWVYAGAVVALQRWLACMFLTRQCWHGSTEVATQRGIHTLHSVTLAACMRCMLHG
eukprot:366052-Chlamydomonas_euryale.AAC.33